VTGAQGKGVAVVRRRARTLGVPLTEVSPGPLLSLDRDGIVVDLPALGHTRIGLRGRHQAANAAVADATLEALATAGIATTTPDARRAGYRSARWPGRLELIDANGRDVLLDGAHNPAGAAALAQALDDLRPYLHAPTGNASPLTLLMGVMADKDVAGMVAALAGAAALRSAHIICTRLDLGRALPAEELAAHWRGSLAKATISVEPNVGRALDRALADAPGPVVVCGSLYLVGAVRARLVDDPELRDPEEIEAG
jgi:dihydrofolate synthase/folylpolyglutamate synthase